MTRYTLTIPQTDNAGIDVPAAHAYVCARLVDTFGGYTVHEANGAWSDAGRTYVDESFVYTVDVDPAAIVQLREASLPGAMWRARTAAQAVREIAAQARTLARQQCVYVTEQGVAAYTI